MYGFDAAARPWKPIPWSSLCTVLELIWRLHKVLDTKKRFWQKKCWIKSKGSWSQSMRSWILFLQDQAHMKTCLWSCKESDGLIEFICNHCHVLIFICSVVVSHAMRGRGEVWTNGSWVFCRRWRVILLSWHWCRVLSTTEAPKQRRVGTSLSGLPHH